MSRKWDQAGVVLFLLGLGLSVLAGCGSGAGPAGDRFKAAKSAEGSASGDQQEASLRAKELSAESRRYGDNRLLKAAPEAPLAASDGQPQAGGDKFAQTEENPFFNVQDSPLSTFSLDVDTASYSKTRSYLLQQHSLPPPAAVRLEELINYFDYAYPQPTGEQPFAVDVAVAACPWCPQHQLVRFGVQGKRLEGGRPTSNLVFLIDVSGSMNAANKLPLVRRSLELLTQQLGENDSVSIVVYAGAAGVVLPPTRCDNRRTILDKLDSLHAGGATNGGQGIQLAYDIAARNFVKGGVNRVILCTDGDFNVGVTGTGDLVQLASQKAKEGVFLTVLGFGFGDHNDEMLEQIADKANGNYAFIDTEAEARKVLVEQIFATLVTIAKDVKIQVEFNPAKVAAYRLIGYENRKLENRDFNDDKKDAGEVGAGHAVTVMYELTPIGAADPAEARREVDPLKYQKPAEIAQKKEADANLSNIAYADELLTLKLRYQPPAGGKSELLTIPIKDSAQRFSNASPDFQFAAAVASFGMLLRHSQYRGDTSYAAVLEVAAAAKGADKYGYRAEFLQLVQEAKRLQTPTKPDRIPSTWKISATSAPPPDIKIGFAPSRPEFSSASDPQYAPQPLAPFRFGFLGGLIAGISVVVIAAVVGLALFTVWTISPLPPHTMVERPRGQVEGGAS